MNHIALDGPRNGSWITEKQAAEDGYELVDWTSGELAYLHVATAAPVTPEDIPADVQAEIEEELS